LVVPHRFFVRQQRSNGDRHMYAVRTRFIPNTITKHFVQCAWPPATREAGTKTIKATKSVDIGARLKRMWR
jgi:DNA helicase II / ATP-dependent DNA helicase PcrA